MSETLIQIATRPLAKALNIAKITSMQTDDLSIFDYSLFKISEEFVRVTSTTESTISQSTFPLAEVLPEFQDEDLCFLVKASSLLALLGQLEEPLFVFSVDLAKRSLTYRSGSANLTLPLKLHTEWPELDSRLEPLPDDTPAYHIPKVVLKEAFKYTKFYMGADSVTNLIEIRNGLAIASDRTKYGFFESDDFGDLKLRVRGDQLNMVEKFLDLVPDESIKIDYSVGYNLFQVENPFPIIFGFSKCSTTLPETWDQVPEIEEPDYASVDLTLFQKTLLRIQTVSCKNDSRVKLEVSGDKVTLYTVNDTGQESKDSIEITRISGHSRTSVIVPLNTLIKSLKQMNDSTLTFSIGQAAKYIKFFDKTPAMNSYSVFQSMGSLSA